MPSEATHTMTRRIHAVGRSQRGQGISEYVVMLALIVMLEVCQFFCVNDQGLFLGMGARGKGAISPSLAQRF